MHSLRSAPNGDIWVGSEGRGVARIDARTLLQRGLARQKAFPAKTSTTCASIGENRLWAATEAGLFMATAPYRQFSRITELPATRMWAVVQGTDGTVWAGGDSGLFAFAGGHWRTFTRSDGLSNHRSPFSRRRAKWRHLGRLRFRRRH